MYGQPQEARHFQASTGARWYALHTKPRHEKRIGTELCRKGVETFVPMMREVHRWSDRRKVVDVPLFSCYTFVRVDDITQSRFALVSTPGVFRVVGTQGSATPIADEEIAAFQRLLANGVPVANSLFLSIGQRVRIRGGALEGIEGILESQPGDNKIIVSIQLIQRSVSVSLRGFDIEPA